MTQEEYLKITDAIDDAEKSVTPFVVPGDDELVVVGDANETQINKHDFTVTFRVPSKEDKSGYKRQEIEYHDVYITPRQDAKIIRLLVELLPFFRKVQEDGTVSKYQQEEVTKILASFDDTIYDHMYDLVAEVLGVDPRLKNYMEVFSVFIASLEICLGYPELINEAVTFFHASSDKLTTTTVQ